VSRFRSQLDQPATAGHSRRAVSSGLRWRMWLLVAMLGLVIATMRQLNKPRTAERLGKLFSVPAAADPIANETKQEAVESPPAENEKRNAAIVVHSAPRDSGKVPDGDDAHDNELDAIEDNTYFRPAESAAWFGMFERLQKLSPAQFRSADIPELTYAQLLKQPDVYRGKLVTIHGTVRREEIETPAQNDLGLTSYHRLIIQPRGGGHWPFVVYALELPPEFPRGDTLNAPAMVTGYFFKNWSYAWEDGLGLAPVVLARTVDWQPAPVATPRRAISKQGVPKIIAAASVFAALAVWLVLRNTRRPPRTAATNEHLTLPDADSIETVHEQLGRLAEVERGE